MNPTIPYSDTLATYQFGDLCVDYLLAIETGVVGLVIYPLSLAKQILPHRETLETAEVRLMPAPMNQIRAWNVEPLVQFKLQGDSQGGFAQGLTMRGSASMEGLKFERQYLEQEKGFTRVITNLVSERGYACTHNLMYREGDGALTIQTTFDNRSDKILNLEMLASFSLGGITPFSEDDAPGRFYLHRIRSSWSAEGRHECQPIENLNLEPSWSGYGVRCERFGQVGSMPVRGFFPFAAIEDRQAGVFWGTQLAWAGSWQIEIYRRDDCLSLSAGLADREFGHWVKKVNPGESFTSPAAILSCVQGDLDDLADRLTRMQQHSASQLPPVENDLPIICNEWCTSWGEPTHEHLLRMADRLKGTPVKYLVIDAGWYKSDDGSWGGAQGDWNPNPRLFPQGLAATAAAIRERGLIPGIWFEMEVCGEQSSQYDSEQDHFLMRDGIPISAGGRRFWDFRDPWVVEYLRQKVIGLLRECGFGYMKVDYNETIGIGCDGAESLGEGLREHIQEVQEFFRKIHTELPDLVIENCSSGGHRLEPSMMALASMGSFSDAHECQDIPIIAANLQRLILPRQSQIWAVLHSNDTDQRLVYSLCAGFLGRLCLSGEITQLSEPQWMLVTDAMRFYRKITPILASGHSRLFQKIGPSWRHPKGSQAVLRISENEEQALVVVHHFGEPRQLEVPLPGNGRWMIGEQFPASSNLPEIQENRLLIRPGPDFESQAIHLIYQGK